MARHATEKRSALVVNGSPELLAAEGLVVFGRGDVEDICAG